MNPTVYSHGLSYEFFIRRAHRCHQNFRTAAHAGHYQAIYWAEHSYLPNKRSHEQQLEKVKVYVSKAITRFLKRRLRQKEREELLAIQHLLKNVYNEPTLFEVIDKALIATDRFKEYDPK